MNRETISGANMNRGTATIADTITPDFTDTRSVDSMDFLSLSP